MKPHELILVEYLADCRDAGVQPNEADFDEWVQWRQGGAPADDPAQFRGFEVGHISKRKDGEYKKIGEGKWQRVGGGRRGGKPAAAAKKSASAPKRTAAQRLEDRQIERARAAIKAGACDKLQAKIEKIQDTNSRRNWLARNEELGAFDGIDFGADEFQEFIDSAEYSPSHKKAMKEAVRAGGEKARRIVFNAAMRIGKGDPMPAMRALFRRVGGNAFQDQFVDDGEMGRIAELEAQKRNLQWLAAKLTSRESDEVESAAIPFKAQTQTMKNTTLDTMPVAQFAAAFRTAFRAAVAGAFAKRAEIGAISKDGTRKKVAEGKWERIKKGRKPASKSSGGGGLGAKLRKAFGSKPSPKKKISEGKLA